MQNGPCFRAVLKLGAEERTRTFTPLRAQAPEACASANSATSAHEALGTCRQARQELSIIDQTHSQSGIPASVAAWRSGPSLQPSLSFRRCASSRYTASYAER